MPPRHRPDLTEMMDDPDVDRQALHGNLRDLRLCNGALRWRAAANRAVRNVLRGGPARVLDVATGSADMPLALAGGARVRALECWAADSSAGALAEATKHDRRGVLRLVRCDARWLPFGAGAFDAVTLHLALHHFAWTDAVAVLAELGRVGCRVVVTDLERSWFAYTFARALPLVTRNPLTRHDGRVSVLRAYTRDELRRLAVDAGLRAVRVERRFPARLVMTAIGREAL